MANTKKITNINVGRRALETEGIENNWESLDINNFTPSQNANVFIFGGNTTNSTATANGNAKIIQNLIDPQNLSQTNIYSFYYNSETLSNANYLNKPYEEDAIKIFNKIFKPMIYDKKGNIKSLKGIEEVFNKMVLTAHCAGANFAEIIINKYHETLKENFAEATAKFLVNKIQYFAYAPNVIPEHNVKGLYITPFADNHGGSWGKALSTAEEKGIYTDYPKGVVKKLLKAKYKNDFENACASEFKQNRAFMFKIGNSTFITPSAMNPNISIGDHTIECISKPHILKSGTDLELTAQIVNFASRLYFNEFLNKNLLDTKGSFTRVADAISQLPPIAQNTISK